MVPWHVLPCKEWRPAEHIGSASSRFCACLQFADRDQDALSPLRERDISIFFRAQCAEMKDMAGNKAVFGLRMRRHMVTAVQSAGDPHAHVHCTTDAGRVGLPALQDAILSLVCDHPAYCLENRVPTHCRVCHLPCLYLSEAAETVKPGSVHWRAGEAGLADKRRRCCADPVAAWLSSSDPGSMS